MRCCVKIALSLQYLCWISGAQSAAKQAQSGPAAAENLERASRDTPLGGVQGRTALQRRQAVHVTMQMSSGPPQRPSRFAFDARIDSSVASGVLDDDPLSEALRGSAFTDDPLAGGPADETTGCFSCPP